MSAKEVLKPIVKKIKKAVDKENYEEAIALGASLRGKLAFHNSGSRKEAKTLAKIRYEGALLCGFAYSKMGRADDAINQYKTACLAKSEETDPWKGLLELYREQKDTERQKECLEQLIGLSDRGSKKFYSYSLQLADALEQMSKTDECMRVLIDMVGADSKQKMKAWSGSKLLDGWLKLISLAEKKEAEDIENATKQNILAKRKRMADEKGGKRKKKKVQNAPLPSLGIREQEKIADETAKAWVISHTELEEYLRRASWYKSGHAGSHKKLLERMQKRLEALEDEKSYSILHSSYIAEVQRMSENFPEDPASNLCVVHELLSTDANEKIKDDLRPIIRNLCRHEIKNEKFTVDVWSIWVSFQILEDPGRVEKMTPVFKWIMSGIGRVRVEFEGEVVTLSRGAELLRFKDCVVEAVVRAFYAEYLSKQRPLDVSASVFHVKSGLKAAKRIQPSWGTRSAEIQRHLQLTLAEIYLQFGGGKKLDQSVKLFQRYFDSNSEDSRAMEGLCNALMISKQYEEVLKFCENLKLLPERETYADSLASWVLYLMGKFEEAEDHISKCIEKQDATSLDFLRMGIVLWQKGGEFRTDRKHSYKYFLIAAKSDASNADAFAYLGHFFYTVADKVPKAKQCYLKAVKLNPACQQAGIMLGGFLVRDEKFDEAIALYEAAITKDRNAKWAYLPLGCIYQNQSNFQEAIRCFQHALRCDSDDSHTWCALAECYLFSGKYTACMKSCEQSLELKKDRRAQLILCRAQSMVGLTDDAIATLETLCLADASYLPTHYYLAWCYFAEVHLCVKRGSYKVARRVLTQCIDNLNSCNDIQSHRYGCVAKLLADAKTTFGMLPLQVEFDRLDLTPELVEEQLEHLKEGYELYESLLEGAQSNQGDTWVAMSINRFYGARACAPFSSKQYTQQSFLKQAVECIQKALTFDAENSTYWTLLGVFSMENFDIAQHCFFKAATFDPMNNMCWEHLALLYSNVGESEKAMAALVKAQGLAPASCFQWQVVGALNVGKQQTRAYNAFLRALDLNSNSASRLAYAYYALHKGDVQDAYFHMQHFVDRHPFDVYGHALFAHVATKLEKFQTAATETERILQLSDATGLTSPNITIDRLALQKRLCALYVKTGHGDKALELLQVVGEDPNLAQTKAKAYIVAGKFDEAQFLYNDIAAGVEDEDLNYELMLGQVQARWIEGTKDVALSQIRNQCAWNPSLLPLLAIVLFLSREFEEALQVLKQIEADADLSKKRKQEMEILHAKILIMKKREGEALELLQSLEKPCCDEALNLRRKLELPNSIPEFKDEPILFYEDSTSLRELELRVMGCLWTDGDDFFSSGMASVCGLRYADPENKLASKLAEAGRLQYCLSTGDSLNGIDAPLSQLLSGDPCDMSDLKEIDQQRLHGMNFERQGEVENAAKAFREVAMNSRLPSDLENYARVNPDDGLALIEDTLINNDSPPPRLKFMKAYFFMKKHMIEDAIALLEEMKENSHLLHSKEVLTLYLLLALSHYHDGNLEKAREAWENCPEDSPKLVYLETLLWPEETAV